MSNATEAEAAKARAEAIFKKQQLLAEADSNRQAVEAARIAEAEKTAKLRALRLAKETANEASAPARNKA
jgi:hypothetical protein